MATTIASSRIDLLARFSEDDDRTRASGSPPVSMRVDCANTASTGPLVFLYRLVSRSIEPGWHA
jgi:hypothetical protein